jgi:hypothetical protein
MECGPKVTPGVDRGTVGWRPKWFAGVETAIDDAGVFGFHRPEHGCVRIAKEFTQLVCKDLSVQVPVALCQASRAMTHNLCQNTC